MIYLRALGLYLADRICVWCDGGEPVDFAGAIYLVRALDREKRRAP